jgi:DNA-directed RNA polymerase
MPVDYERTAKRFYGNAERQVKGFGYAAGPEGRILIERYVEPLTRIITKARRKRSQKSLRPELFDALVGASSRALAVSILAGTLNAIASRKPGDTSVAPQYKRIGQEIWRECRGVAIKRADKEVAAEISRKVVRIRRGNTMAARKRLEHNIAQEHNIEYPEWSPRQLFKAGAWAVDCLSQLVLRNPSSTLTNVFPVHDNMVAIDASEIDDAALIVKGMVFARPVFIVSLEPPAPWVSFQDADGTPFVRKAQNQGAGKAAMASGQMQAHVDAVNSLQNVGFKINQRMLDFVTKAAEHPEGKLLLRKVKYREGWATFRLDMATASWLGERPFWNPLSLDTRGRVYAMPFFHFGRADHIRGLFLLKHGEPITGEGTNWLKRAAARAYGIRTSFSERLQWANQNLENILAVANDPMSQLKWLQSAKHPFQFTAICMELQQALAEGPGFITHLPIELDASCSGAQHYSLLSHNANGARLTNLVTTELDQVMSLYKGVLNCIRRQVGSREFIDRGAETTKQVIERGFDPNDALASWWSDRLDLDLIKALVMPYLYGAERRGLIGAVYKELYDRGFVSHKHKKRDADDNRETIPQGAPEYLVDIVLQVLEGNDESTEAFVVAPEIREFLESIADTLAKKEKPIEWISPTGLPISNLYYKKRIETVQTWLNDKPKRNRLTVGYGKFNKQKVVNAIAPNLVHSLDAAHLVAVANACAREEITLTTIHDCFATTANLVPRLQRILLEQLYELYVGAGGEVLAQIRKNAIRTLRETRPLWFWEVYTSDDEGLDAVPLVGMRGPDGKFFELYEILSAEYAFS